MTVADQFNEVAEKSYDMDSWRKVNIHEFRETDA